MWTTKSPGLRSRKSERKAAAFDFRFRFSVRLRSLGARGPSFNRVDGFVKDVCLDVNDQPRLRQLKTATETADGHNDRMVACGVGSFAGKRQTRFDLVLVENLDDSFSNTKTRHHEQRGLRFFRGASNFSSEIGNAAVITHRRLRLPFNFQRCFDRRKQKHRLARAARATELDLWRFSFQRKVQIGFRGGATQRAQLDSLARLDQLRAVLRR